MLQQRHFGGEISRLNQGIAGISARQHNMGHGRLAVFEEGQNLGLINIAIAHRDIDFIEQNHVQLATGDQLLGLAPCRLGRLNITFLVLGFPGEPFPHGVKLAGVTEMGGDQVALAGIKPALDELHHA